MTDSTGPLVEHFFRHEYANLIAVLCRAFGLNRIELVEDMVQAAMVQAITAWRQSGLPDNPAGWIHRVAKNRILDHLRREKIHQTAMAMSGQSVESENQILDHWLDDRELPDSLLRMMFVCCHPMLERRTQIALTLKILGGFGLREIASGLLMSEESVKKRIQRAKKSLAEQNVQLEMPARDELQSRLTVVHEVLYLMFNEGYSTSHGDRAIRDDICEEATRLCHLLCENRFGNNETGALLALMLFHAARLESRVRDDGAAILLSDQDRSKWDQRLIRAGEHWLHRCRPPTHRFHLEASIALLHCKAQSVDDTRWEIIVQLYDRLLGLVDSPVYVLNRAVAMGQCGKFSKALEELESIRQHPKMENYFLLDCAEARIHELSGNHQASFKAWRRALQQPIADHQRRWLEEKLSNLNPRETG